MGRRDVCLLGLISALLLLSVSNESFWIDEMTCKRIADSETVGTFIESMADEGGSDSQMPVFQACMFVWQNLVNGNEWGFRAINVLLCLMGLTPLVLLFSARELPPWSIIVAVGTSAFLWFYMNEARPYVMQFSGASCLLVGYWKMLDSRQYPDWRKCGGDWFLLVFGTVMCAGGSLLGAPFAGIIFLCVIIICWSKWALLRRSDIAWLLVWCCVLGGLAIYYLWTLYEGKGASAANQTSILTLGFSAFEQLGFMPFGPGRLALRADGPSSLLPWAPFLALWAGCVAVVIWVGGKELLMGPIFRGRIVVAMLPVVLMVLLLVIGGYVGGFRVLGRHFMPIYPVVLLVAGLAYLRLAKGGRVGTSILVAIVIVSSLGCLTQRFSERHLKDDYRGAVAYVNSSAQQTLVVWWAAGGKVSSIYPFDDHVKLYEMKNCDAEALAKFPSPDIVVLSKEDLFDSKGEMKKWLYNNNYHKGEALPAFQMYHRHSNR